MSGDAPEARQDATTPTTVSASARVAFLKPFAILGIVPHFVVLVTHNFDFAAFNFLRFFAYVRTCMAWIIRPNCAADVTPFSASSAAWSE